MKSTTKHWQRLALLAGVAAGVLTWVLLRWPASGPSVVLARGLAGQPSWVRRVLSASDTLVSLGATWGLLAGWRKGLPPFAPGLLCSGAVAAIVAHGSASIVVGASCLLLGALAAQPQSIPVAVRRCVALAALLVFVASIAGF